MLKDDIVKKYFKDNEQYEFVANEMKEKEETLDVSIFFVRGKLRNVNSYTQEDLDFVVVIDFNNKKFSIIPENDYNNTNINVSKDFYDGQENRFNMSYLTNEEIARKIYKRFINEEIYDTENAYKMLENEYAKKRFETLEGFKEYINENKDNLLNGVIIKFSYENKENNITIYKFTDEENNYYTIEVKDIVEIQNVKLDDYTVKNEEYIEKYNKLSDEEKVKTNLDNIIKMINSKDYDNLYNLLNNVFKNNNFDNIDKFKNFINERTFDYNVLTVNKIEQNSENIYVSNITLASGNNLSAEYKDLAIIMKLNENDNFEISFEL